MSIEVEGVQYKVVENMGFNHGLGKYAKAVSTPDGERVVTKYPGGIWKFHTPILMPMSQVRGQDGDTDNSLRAK